MRQIMLDTETTGLEPKEGHRIIEIGCVELINRKFTSNNFHRYINPEREVERGALKVHGITNGFLRNKPIFAQIYDDFIDYLNGAELVIHNAPFDLGFLNHEFKLLKPKKPKLESSCSVIDTLVMARKLHSGQRNSLDALCKRYQVDNSNRKLHGALLDAELLGKVYLAMTGGQGSLFGDEENPKKRIENKNPLEPEVQLTKPLTKKWDLPVVLANAEELKAHEAYMEQITQ